MSGNEKPFRQRKTQQRIHKTMKSKWILYVGIILLMTGIILRKITDLDFEAILFIIVGLLFKVYFIISKARSGEYKVGYELVFLIVGLLMILSGIYLRLNDPTFNSNFLILFGILLKVIFIILFIVNIKPHRKTLK
ncbi:MAG: hypothetical protein ABFR32_11550 [Bacteroidota bacterium]